jgi:two-component system, NtrC family, nitrogen regulation sensor histidine kinase NtrY
MCGKRARSWEIPTGAVSGGTGLSEGQKSRRLWLALGGLGLALLAAAVFTLGSLKAPVHPQPENVLAFFALSTFTFIAFLVFGSVLARSIVRLWTESRAGRLGSRFKTKMVLGAIGISLLPIVFLFFVSYALVNRTLNLWFPKPLETASSQTQRLLDEVTQQEAGRLAALAQDAAEHSFDLEGVRNYCGRAADAAWWLDDTGNVVEALRFNEAAAAGGKENGASDAAPLPHFEGSAGGGAEIWRIGDMLYLTAHGGARGSELVLGRRLPQDFMERLATAREQTAAYETQRQQLRIYKVQILITLLLATLLLLFATTWVALYLSKLVTVPIQALAEATQEVARGNLEHRVDVAAHDELGTLVNSFNEMTAQLAESRRQIDSSTHSLEQAIEERERRGKLMETILENIPTGVVSLESNGTISRMNTAMANMFGETARSARTLGELAGEETAREITHLMRRSLRMGAVTRELEISAGGRLLQAAVTASSLGPRRANPGYVVVMDDLTELLRAQKAAAWQEVAQRIAHEIKNPLTPIQLSAQRILRWLELGQSAGSPAGGREFESLASECALLIEQEAGMLASLVDEFSQFVRFPTARLGTADANQIAEASLDSFHGRLEGIQVQRRLAAGLPAIKADEEQMRRVLVNLIDNAAEAMEGCALRRLDITTRADAHGDAVEIEVADTGPGIGPEDKERLFLPHFSTKGRGTGLGLAIASRIVAEHNGTLRVEDNAPSGTRFVVRLPAAEIAAGTFSPNASPAPAASSTGSAGTGSA